MSQSQEFRVEPVILPDVATPGHPSLTLEPVAFGGKAEENSSEAGDTKLQDVLPQITEIAQKVGGFKKLSELADTLSKMGK